jgi:hypothetical protein
MIQRRHLHFSLLELLLSTAVVAIFIAINLSPDRSTDEFTPWSSTFVAQACDRGWPASYQAVREIESAHGPIQIARLKSEFVTKTSPNVTSLLALTVNLSALLGILMLIHLGYSFVRSRLSPRECNLSSAKSTHHRNAT